MRTWSSASPSASPLSWLVRPLVACTSLDCRQKSSGRNARPLNHRQIPSLLVPLTPPSSPLAISPDPPTSSPPFMPSPLLPFTPAPQQKLNVSNPSLGNVQDNWSLLRRVVPVDLAVPITAGVVLSAAVIVSQRVCMACIVCHQPLPFPHVIFPSRHLSLTSSFPHVIIPSRHLSLPQLPRFIWRLLLPSFALYGGLYTYEKLTWTDRSKEAALKQQVQGEQEL